MNFYDEEIKQAIASLPQHDRLALVESLFNGMVNTMRAYYLDKGHSDREIQMLIQTEVNGVKKLISERVNAIPKPVEEVEIVELPAMDDQFFNDASIDLGIILENFGVQD